MDIELLPPLIGLPEEGYAFSEQDPWKPVVESDGETAMTRGNWHQGKLTVLSNSRGARKSSQGLFGKYLLKTQNTPPIAFSELHESRVTSYTVFVGDSGSST